MTGVANRGLAIALGTPMEMEREQQERWKLELLDLLGRTHNWKGRLTGGKGAKTTGPGLGLGKALPPSGRIASPPLLGSVSAHLW